MVQDPVHVSVSSVADVVEQRELYFLGLGEASVVQMKLEDSRNVSLSCNVRGERREATSVSWFRENLQIDGNSRETVERFTNGSSVLRLLDVGLSDEATYYCLVSDPSNEQSIRLQIDATVISEWGGGGGGGGGVFFYVETHIHVHVYTANTT